MSGFKLNLKGKANSKGINKPTKTLGFGIRKNKTTITKQTAFDASDSEGEDENKKITIDSFVAGSGASINGKSIQETKKKGPLVIKPNEASDWKLLLQKRRENSESLTSSNTDVTDDDERIRQSLITGEKFESADGLSIKIDKSIESEEFTYDKVPVDDFGAALLRGMGWNAKSKQSKATNFLENRKRGDLLGIGAKGVEDELMTNKEKKFEVPMIKREKK